MAEEVVWLERVRAVEMWVPAVYYAGLAVPNAPHHAQPLPHPPTRGRLHRIAEGNIMVVIRLARGGAKGRPFYNIVVAHKRERRDGRFIERVGFYNPMASGADQPLSVAFDRVTYWSGVGAQLSPTVARLVDEAKAKTVAAA